MGVVLQMGFVLMFIMAGIEIYVNNVFRPEKYRPETYPALVRPVMRLVHHLGPLIESSAVYALLFSFALSVLLGFIYPIAGIAAFIGGVGSTLLVQPYYLGKRILAQKASQPRRAKRSRVAQAPGNDLRAKLGR